MTYMGLAVGVVPALGYCVIQPGEACGCGSAGTTGDGCGNPRPGGSMQLCVGVMTTFMWKFDSNQGPLGPPITFCSLHLAA